MAFTRSSAIAMALSMAACSAGDTAGKDVPVDTTVRLHHVQMKGTHNSFHVATPSNPDPELAISQRPLGVQLADEGVRQVELDLHVDATMSDFDVYHVDGDTGTTCPR